MKFWNKMEVSSNDKGYIYGWEGEIIWYAYRRGDGLAIIGFAPEEVDALIVDFVPCDDGTKHVDGEAHVGLTHLEGDEVDA
jgi:hypothetical protein